MRGGMSAAIPAKPDLVPMWNYALYINMFSQLIKLYFNTFNDQSLGFDRITHIKRIDLLYNSFDLYSHRFNLSNLKQVCAG